jgi:hypothetical protein
VLEFDLCLRFHITVVPKLNELGSPIGLCVASMHSTLCREGHVLGKTVVHKCFLDTRAYK